MKLLGWMHRKFRQNSSEPFKDLVIGQPAVVDDEITYPKANFGSKHVKQSEYYHRKIISFGGVEDDEYEEESSGGGGNGMYELFHGFLTIGTLGSEQVGYSDPSTTPTFAFYVENITEKGDGDEVSENEVKVINEELEKVLGKEDGSSNYNYDSSGRNSTAGRRSSYSYSNGYGSTITVLSDGKPKELGTDQYSNTSAVCPLQEYLFGSAIELSETTKAAAKNKEHRTSLGELFQRSKLAEDDDNFGAKSENDIIIDHQKTADREADNKSASASASASAMHLMKKKLKKTMQLHPTGTGGPVVDSASAEKKLHKILHMFHRKVHPENSQKCDKHQKNEKKKKKKKKDKKKIMNEVGGSGNNKSEAVHPDPEEEKDIMLNLHPKIRALANANAKEISMRQNKSQSNSLQRTLDSTEEYSWENENREHWIKTDADYLVLEL